MSRDYMSALRQRFHVASARTTELERATEAAYATLHDTLNREQQRLLLRLRDAEEQLRDEESLDAFRSGFKLADGIRGELGAPYSCEDESERRAVKSSSQ